MGLHDETPKDPFNISNDKYYNPKHSKSGRIFVVTTSYYDCASYYDRVVSSWYYFMHFYTIQLQVTYQFKIKNIFRRQKYYLFYHI